ncbi:MAG TPA: acyl-CoA dehydrogenase family protein [Kofleriaceae bacterium]|nr:acyl-CoA dehydrogenase family protein [Kofleriaceae bacterium]
MANVPKDFGYTSDHDLLRTTARRLLGDKCPIGEVRRLIDDARGWNPALLAELGELGWLGLVLDEAHGGAGLDHLSLALLLEETGKALLPGPHLAATLGGIAVQAAGSETQRARWLPAIADGSMVATVAFTEPSSSWEPPTYATTARADGDGWVLDGIKTHVAYAADAALVLVPASLDGELALFGVPTSLARIAPEVTLDSTRRTARLTFENARVDSEARLDARAWPAIQSRALLCIAAEAVGAGQAILAQTRAYAIERTQFGRPIGSFQAVKHPIVNVMIAIEKARSLTYYAAAALDHDPAAAPAYCRAAVTAAQDALSFAADRGVQIHGGYGFTWDCDAHLFMKRSLAGVTLRRPVVDFGSAPR